MRISKQIIVSSLLVMVGLMVACAPLVRPPVGQGAVTPEPATRPAETPAPPAKEGMPPSPYITLTPGPTTVPGKLVYYWPRYIPEGYSKQLFLNRSFADKQGYSLWLSDPMANIIVISGGLQRQGDTQERVRLTLKGFCDLGCIPFATGPFVGWKSGGTGAGFGYGWELDGQFYDVAGMSGGAHYYDQVTASLEPVDLQTWLQRLAALP